MSLTPLAFICEWADCHDAVFEDMVIFSQHVAQHGKEECASEAEERTCHWFGCEESFQTDGHFTLHVAYHAYHSRLMSLGSVLLDDLKTNHENLADCGHDACSRTLLPDLPEVLVCLWKDCQGEFLDPQSFYQHASSHAMEEITIPAISKEELKVTRFAKCQWELCNHASKTKTALRVHLKGHTQEKEVACPTCGSMFYDKQKFRDHILRQLEKNNADSVDTVDQDKAQPETLCPTTSTETQAGKFKCHECVRYFATKRLRDEHARRHVSFLQTLNCEFCDFKSSTKSGMRKHHSYRHSVERPFNCQFCDLRFKSRYDLRKHLYVHDEDQRFKCPDCDFSCRTSESLQNHTRTYHEKEMSAMLFQCHIESCSKCFTRGNNLSRHLTRVHKLRPPSGHSRFSYSLGVNDTYRLKDHLKITSGSSFV